MPKKPRLPTLSRGFWGSACVALLALPAQVTADSASVSRPPAAAAYLDVAAAQARLEGPDPKAVSLLKRPELEITKRDLAELAPVATPQPLEANSEQRQPFHVGASPRELALGAAPPAKQRPRLPLALKELSERQAALLLAKLQREAAEFELWPTMNDVGRLTFVVSRYRESAGAPWQWLDDALLTAEAEKDPNRTRDPLPILPHHYHFERSRDVEQVFADLLEQKDLYDKPQFSECVWVRRFLQSALAGWLKSSELVSQRHLLAPILASPELRKTLDLRCLAMPQPSRFQGRAMTFHLRAATAQTPRVKFQEDIEWVAPPESAALKKTTLPLPATVKLPRFPPTFDADYHADLAAFSGAQPIALPNGKSLSLQRKNCADPAHQLEVMLDVVEARYQKLGLVTRRQRFTWRGIPQSNLVAVLPRTLPADKPQQPSSSPPPLKGRPILLADHIDTAFCEDLFYSRGANHGKRLSAPGADDNVSGMAAVLRAAEVLLPLPRKEEVWLVHLTGEEFPGDDLGARRFIDDLLASGQDVGALLLFDMIGVWSSRHADFGINPGGFFESGRTSLAIADLSARLAGKVSPNLRPQIHPPGSLTSYLYNTDGILFAESGYPVVFFNELMNRYYLSRDSYHQTSDRIDQPMFSATYAAQIARVAIATAAVLAQTGAPAIPRR